MSEDNKRRDDDKNPKKSGEFRVPPRTMVVWIAILGGITLLMLFKDRMDTPGEVLNQYKFQQLVASNQIAQATINYNPQSPDLREITGKYWKDPEHKIEVPFRAKVRLLPDLEEEVLKKAQFEPREPNTMLFSFLLSVLPIIVIAALIWFFFIRQIKMAGKGALSFGKSKARLLAKERNKTTFKDVAGFEEAIQ